MDRLAIVIPARMASSRFPGKPLVDLCGKPMVQWVYEACAGSELDARIVVAAPDQAIVRAATAFGAEAILTRESHPSGTDRLAEVAETIKAEVYLNVQGDEPLIDPNNLRRCVELMGPGVQMASLFVPAEGDEFQNPAAVKVVTDGQGWALYFSRSLIPYPRNEPSFPVKKHLGIYAYSGEVLTEFTKWPVSALEATEGLEQLRFLENGIRIKMAEGIAAETAVDTPEQAEQVRAILRLRAAKSANT